MGKKKDGISVVASEDFNAYASGRKGAHEVRCLMCQKAPCTCKDDDFGSPSYMARLRQIHGK